MKILQLTVGVTIIDDFLGADVFSELWNSIEKLRYDFPSSEWMRLWPLSDPQPVMSSPFIWSKRPCGFGVDQYIEQFAACVSRPDVWEHEPPAWDDIAFRVFLHGRGSRMVAHSDAPKYSGAGIFYAHQNWKAEWGGELCIPSVTARHNFTVREENGESITNSRISNILLEEATGIYIVPKPNRLVLIRGGVLHYTNRVDLDAGANLRCSLTSFLISGDVDQSTYGSVKTFRLD